MQRSSTTKTYGKMLASMDETIEMLTAKREGILASYRQSQMSDILEQDAAWLADAKASPRNWAYLLDTKTPSREWLMQVALEGVTGSSEWAYSEQRAVAFKLFTEVPERMDLYAWLIEEMMPFMTPWSPTMRAEDGCRIVSINTPHANFLLGKTAQDTWFFKSRTGRAETFADVKSALDAAQKGVARSFFYEES